MKLPSILEMLQAGVHFGHQVSRWHPKMKEYIFTHRNRVHIIDLDKTLEQLQIILPEVQKMAAQGKKILFVSTKPQARAIVKQAAIDCGMPYLTARWLGGMLTNFPEIKKLVRKYATLKDKLAKGELGQYTKKEQLDIAKMVEKQDSYLSGLVDLSQRPDALFIPSVHMEKTAVTESNRMNIPIIGVCDTNANASKVEYVIPANDDAVKSIEMIVGLVRDAVKEGVAELQKNTPAVPVKTEKAPVRAEVKREE